MTPNAESFARWLVIGRCGVLGIYALADGLVYLSEQTDADWVLRWVIMAPTFTSISCVLMSVSYLTFRRRYQTICTLTAFVLAFAAFIIVASFPDWVGLIDRSNPSDDVRIGGPATFIAVAALAVAILVARWVFRKGRPLLARIFLDGWR